MKNRTMQFVLLAGASILFILYALVKNYVVDPGADGFISQKAGLKREFHLPVWLNVMYIHVAFACIAMASGLLNFSSRIFEKSRVFHRINGYCYLASVFVVVVTSGYMAPYATGGKISSMGFNLLNILWPIITITALIHIKKKQIIRHRNWMIRSYAFCYTNLSIHLIATIFHDGFGFVYAVSYTLGVYGSIVLLLILPEAVIRTIMKPREHD